MALLGLFCRFLGGGRLSENVRMGWIVGPWLRARVSGGSAGTEVPQSRDFGGANNLPPCRRRWAGSPRHGEGTGGTPLPPTAGALRG